MYLFRYCSKTILKLFKDYSETKEKLVGSSPFLLEEINVCLCHATK